MRSSWCRSDFVADRWLALRKDVYRSRNEDGDVVKHAHALGFVNVVVHTNGTFPLTTSADTVFVSVDGLQPTSATSL